MNRLLTLPVLLLTLLVGNPASSADFQKGVDAAQSGDYATALREFHPFAEQGDVDAQYSLGVMYETGDGIPQDNLRELILLAEQGNANAQFILGSMYYNGQGVLQNDKTAVKWYTLAAEQGNADAQHALGVMHEEGRDVE